MNLAEQLIKATNEGFTILTNVSDESYQSSPEKWSVKQILGHLIDSANNNHRRFVKAQHQDNLIFMGYQQEEWVLAQNYSDADWALLINLWNSYNLHIAYVISQIPEEKLMKNTAEHNFHKMGWRDVAEGEPSNLYFLIEDYILHMQHHLEQIKTISLHS